MKRWKFKNKKRIKQVQPVVLLAHVYLQRTDEPHAWFILIYIGFFKRQNKGEK